jgi:RNA polymerase sigma factor (sigma-70 family)
MTARPCLRPIIGHLRQLARHTAQADASDRQLLEIFARDRDDEAFRVLVRRHAALVLGVCRRALRNRQDAEDCFQATFLVLARKAGAIRWQESVAGWLHQVAARLAAEIRVREARRRRREHTVAAEMRPTGKDEVDLRELGATVDEELRRLPERARLPLLLCYLQGQTRDQAALLLGLSLRTFERRLQNARDMLRGRLARRGVTLSAGLMAWGLAQETLSAIPAGLVAVTARDAVGFVNGDTASRAALLAGQAVRAMLWEKVRWVAGLALTMGLFVAAAGLRGQPTAAVPPEPTQPTQAGVIGVPAGQRDAAQTPPAPPARIQEVGTAAAVENGLRWLVRQQTQDGGWKIEGGAPNDVAATALALLPLLQAADGRDPARRLEPHAEAVRRGLKYLAGMQKADGGFDGGMYAHAMASWALADGYRLTSDAKLKQPAQLAIDYIVKAQHEGGGWRYAPGQAGDTSVTSWHVVALKRGEKAGLQVPAHAFDKAGTYLNSVTPDGGASYVYVPQAGQIKGTPAMTAGAVMCRQLLGWKPRDPVLLKGAATLEQNSPAPTLANAYYYHFATRAMHGTGGPEWEAWEPKMATILLGRQDRDGSWSPAGDLFGQAGGRLMITSLSLMALEPCGQLTVPAPGAARKLKDGEAAQCWKDLTGDNFARVRGAMLKLVGAPDQAVPMLREQLKPVQPADAKLVAGLIAALGSDVFEDRSAAFRELRGFGERAAGPLRKALKGTAELELRRRIEQLLDEAERDAHGPERTRMRRAIQVLELAGTPEARQLLRTLAQGAPDAHLTDSAKEALDRLGKQPLP